MVPWFEPEITPTVLTPGVHRYGMTADDRDANVRGVIEGQQMAMALHARWMEVSVDSIYATGGAAANRDILQVMADVFGAPVHQLQVENSAALGAALMAMHGSLTADGVPGTWDAVIKDFVEPLSGVLTPDPARHAVYEELMKVYARLELDARERAEAIEGTEKSSPQR
jgi:xylulokinase